MKAKHMPAALAAALLACACCFFGCQEKGKGGAPQYVVGDKITMELHPLDNGENRDKTFNYLYIDPLGDVRSLTSDSLEFIAEYAGEYTLRYLVYDRGFEIEMTDTVITVVPAEVEK